VPKKFWGWWRQYARLFPILHHHGLLLTECSMPSFEKDLQELHEKLVADEVF